MKNLAIITARSGSKGLKDKNIRLLDGKPLLAYTIQAAIESNIFDEIYVSTDSEKYREIALKYGASVPFLRSEENATDNATSWDTVKEAIEKYEKTGMDFDTITLLQPTSPLRSSVDIVNGYNLLKENSKALGVIGVCEMEHSPLWSAQIDNNFSMKEFSNKFVPRQKLPMYYRINGALWIIKKELLFHIEDLYLESIAYIMPQERSIDIDSEFDFKLAEIIRHNYERNDVQMHYLENRGT